MKPVESPIDPKTHVNLTTPDIPFSVSVSFEPQVSASGWRFRQTCGNIVFTYTKQSSKIYIILISYYATRSSATSLDTMDQELSISSEYPSPTVNSTAGTPNRFNTTPVARSRQSLTLVDFSLLISSSRQLSTWIIMSGISVSASAERYEKRSGYKRRGYKRRGCKI